MAAGGDVRPIIAAVGGGKVSSGFAIEPGGEARRGSTTVGELDVEDMRVCRVSESRRLCAWVVLENCSAWLCVGDGDSLDRFSSCEWCPEGEISYKVAFLE